MSKMDDYIEEGNKWEEVGLYELKKDKKVYRISTILLSIGMTISILVACWALFTKEVLIEILEVDRESDRRSLLTVIKAGETLEIEQQEALLMGGHQALYRLLWKVILIPSKNTNAECVASRSISEVYRGYEAYTKNGAEEVLGVTGMVKVKIDNINTLTADNNIVVAHVSLYPQKFWNKYI